MGFVTQSLQFHVDSSVPWYILMQGCVSWTAALQTVKLAGGRNGWQLCAHMTAISGEPGRGEGRLLLSFV